MPSNPVVTLFKNRNFVCLWIIQIITQIGANMLLFILAVQVYQASGSNTAVGLLFLVYGAPNIALAALAGALVDRFGAKRIMLVSNGLRVPILLAFIFFHQNVVAALVLAFIFSVVTQFFFPAGGVILPTLVSKDALLLPANSFFSFTFYLSLLFGFIGAGYALNVFGDTGIYLFLAVNFLLATYLCGFLPPPLHFFRQLKDFFIRRGYKDLHLKFLLPISDPLGHLKKNYQHLRQVSRDLWHVVLLIYRKPVIFTALLLLAFTQVTLSILLSLAPGFSAKVMLIPLTDASTFIILPAGLGMIIGALFLARFGVKWSKGRMRLFGLYSIGLVLFALYPFSTLFRFTHLTSFLLFILGVGNALIDVPSQTILQEETDPEIRGRLYGILATSITAGATLPVLVVTGLADLIGVGRVLILVGLIVLAFTLTFQLLLSRPGRGFQVRT